MRRAGWSRVTPMIRHTPPTSRTTRSATALRRSANTPPIPPRLFTAPIQGKVSVRANRVVPPWAATIAVDTDQGHASLDFDLESDDERVSARWRPGAALTRALA